MTTTMTMTNTETEIAQNIQNPKDNEIKFYQSFDDMPLSAQLLRGIYSYGFEKPSLIQQQAIVPLINKGDVIAQAQSGTGKTGAFAIGTLARMDLAKKTIQAIILSPTRELATQTHNVISNIGEHLFETNKNFCGMFVGGTRIQDDIKKVQNGSVLAIGTPGRLLDIIKRGTIVTNEIKMIVLDEADEMLSQGFQEQIYEIFRFMPKDIQICLFSATLSKDVLDITEKFMREPIRILVRQESLTLDGIKQYHIGLENDEQKINTLMDLYESITIAQSVIFVNTRRKADYVSKILLDHDFTVSTLHSEMSKEDREKIMADFRNGISKVLVATDLIARGIDVHHVNIVINYDIPSNMENYLHRIGRSGRFGRKGIAINFITQRDTELLKEIENHYHTVIPELPLNFNSHLE